MQKTSNKKLALSLFIDDKPDSFLSNTVSKFLLKNKGQNNKLIKKKYFIPRERYNCDILIPDCK